MSDNISGQTQGFNALVTAQAAVIQTAADTTSPLDFTIGSVLRAVTEGAAFLGLWLQGLVLQLLTVTRLATSTGTDADSFVNDFGMTRVPGAAATAVMTFGRYTATNQALVPINAQVTSADGTQFYLVIADTTQPTYNAVLGAYLLPAGTATATVTVQNTVVGTAGNVAAGLINVLSTPISGIDYVTNPNPAGGGVAAETDAALRARFVLFINNRSLATASAVGYAVTSVAGVVSYTITQNYDYSGAYDPGSFYVVVDDGSGDPSGTLVQSVLTAIQAVAGAGIRTAAFGATSISVSVSMTMTPTGGYTHAAVVPVVQAAVDAYINGLGLGTTCSYVGCAAAAQAATGVATITNFLLNGGTSDITANSKQVVRASTVTVS